MQDNNKNIFSMCGVLRAGTSRRKPRTAGFTIVELLIVIVVIGILAAITIVAYNGIQQRARDSGRKADIAAIAKAFKLWNIDHSDMPYMTNSSGCGGGYGNGYGWFNLKNGTNYPESMNNCLKTAGYIQQDVADPSGMTSCGSIGADCHAYMVWTCASGTYLYANLESLPFGDGPANGTCGSGWDTANGMNYVVKVE